MSSDPSSHFFRSFCALIFMALPLGGCITSPARNMHEGIYLEPEYRATPETNTNTDAQHSSLVIQDHENIFNAVHWWRLYDDPDLNALITHAFSNNPSLAQMRARLVQASALKDKYSASLWPSLNISAERSTYDGSVERRSDLDLNGAARYEIDLWGKNRALRQSYDLREQASHEDLHAGAITLSANIVESWLNILALVEQENLLRAQIETNQSIYGLQKNRFEMGAASALDVLQQENIVNARKAELPDLLLAQEQAVNALSLLIGGSPNQVIIVRATALPEPLAVPPAGLPSELLNNRPDIGAAWLRLLSRDENLHVARANRLPSFDLSVLYSAGENKFSNIFDSWLLTLAGEIALPVIDRGSLAAEERYQEALRDEAFHAYRETVLNAVNDVENALVDNRFQDRKLVALREQLRAARKTLEQAQFSYANGQSSYINVLSSMTSVQSLERQLISAQLDQARARVTLYRALGGKGWGDIVPRVTTLMRYPGKLHAGTPPQNGHEERKKEQL